MIRRAGKEGLPLAFWAGGLAGAGLALSLGAVAVGLQASGRLDRAAAVSMIVAAVIAVATTVVAVIGAARLSRTIRRLHADAVRRLADPGAPADRPEREYPALSKSSELADLARALDALHLRVRVADEVAARHRRTAETASVGMFELLSGLVAAEESARGQLSAELHDTAAQSLMLARGMLAAEHVGESDVEAVADLVAEAEDQVRAVMARTRPPALRDGDLAQAVLILRDDLAVRYGLEVDVEWPPAAYPLPLVTAITIYRFFQEALLNVVKHADVDTATIRLVVEEHAVTATVRDEGPGFDPDQVKPERGRHVGLGLLRERAHLAGGALEVSSMPAAGTTLTLRMPRGALAITPEAAGAVGAVGAGESGTAAAKRTA